MRNQQRVNGASTAWRARDCPDRFWFNSIEWMVWCVYLSTVSSSSSLSSSSWLLLLLFKMALTKKKKKQSLCLLVILLLLSFCLIFAYRSHWMPIHFNSMISKPPSFRIMRDWWWWNIIGQPNEICLMWYFMNMVF